MFPKHICNQGNHVPYRLSPQLLYCNSCTLSRDIRLHIDGKNEPKNAQHLPYAPCLACWALSLVHWYQQYGTVNHVLKGMRHELPQSYCGDKRHGMSHSFHNSMCNYIYVYINIYKYIYIYIYIYKYICIYIIPIYLSIYLLI